MAFDSFKSIEDLGYKFNEGIIYIVTIYISIGHEIMGGGQPVKISV